MKKLCFALMIILMVSIFIGCGQKQLVLKGAYQSEVGKIENVSAITISFDQKDSGFVQYIDNRQVDTGTFEKVEGDTYRLQSDRQDYEIVLMEGNIFEITLTKLNGGEPIKMKNVSEIPVSFGNEYKDIDKYQEWLD